MGLQTDKNQKAKNDSTEALATAARQTKDQIQTITKNLGKEIDVPQDRLRIAENKKRIHIFHRAQVGQVCEVLKKLRQVKEVKREEVLAKDGKIKRHYQKT